MKGTAGPVNIANPFLILTFTRSRAQIGPKFVTLATDNEDDNNVFIKQVSLAGF